MNNKFREALRNAKAKGQIKTKTLASMPGAEILPPNEISTAAANPSPIANYVMGKTDDKPILTPRKAKPSLGFKAKILRKPDANNSKPTKTSPRDLLHGTGITKKLAQKHKAAEKKKYTILTKDKAQQIIEEQKQAIEDALLREYHEKDTFEPIDKTIKYDKSQQAAITGIMKEQFACLIGSAGTGKTTCQREIINQIEAQLTRIDPRSLEVPKEDDDRPETAEENYVPAMAFVAFTGRAVQQMKRAIPPQYHHTCNTIHATLGFHPEWIPEFDASKKEYVNKMQFVPHFTAENKLPFEVVFIDEGGMLGIPLWEDLLAALHKSCRIVLIGDINQLQPVQGRSVLGFAMLKWPTFTLEKIHRQAEGNPIINNAHRILHGQLPKKDPKSFAIVNVPDGSRKTFQMTMDVVKTMHKKGLFDPFRDALIVPQNVGNLGQEFFNEKLCRYFNPPKEIDGVKINPRVIVTCGRRQETFAQGDKVMILQNDRRRSLTNGMTGELIELKENPIFAGKMTGGKKPAMTGFGKDLDLSDLADKASRMEESLDTSGDGTNESERAASHIGIVRFGTADSNREIVFSTAGQWNQLRHAYAVTCHKSQGGEYPTVIILCHYSNARMLCREWLYTAVTRAQERVVLICNDRGLSQAVSVQRITGKSVEEKARHFMMLQSKEDTRVPTLPIAAKWEGKTI